MSIVLNDVSYRYPTSGMRGDKEEGWALLHINLEVAEGELLVILGQNGSGKSTLCLTMNGLIPHFFKGRMEGEVLVNGKKTSDLEVTDLVTEISVVFQNPFDQVTGAADRVYDEVAIGPENLGLEREDIRARVEKAIKDTDIEALVDRNPFQLSGGQQQRVALASVLAMRPKIIVFDEPTSQLDPVGTEEVLGVIKNLHDQGLTIVLAEHKVDAIASLATRIVVLKKGRIAKIGKPEEILTDPDLVNLGILPPRPTMLAHDLKKNNIWKRQPPLSIAEAKEGLMEVLK